MKIIDITGSYLSPKNLNWYGVLAKNIEVDNQGDFSTTVALGLKGDFSSTFHLQVTGNYQPGKELQVNYKDFTFSLFSVQAPYHNDVKTYAAAVGEKKTGNIELIIFNERTKNQ